MPIYPVYGVMFVAKGLTPVQIATTLIAWSLTGIVLQIPAGAIADKWSRRGVLAVGQAVRVVGFLIWLVWPTYPGLLIGMMLWGVKSALTSGIFEALLYDELAALDRPEAYARLVGRAAAVGYVAVFAARSAPHGVCLSAIPLSFWRVQPPHLPPPSLPCPCPTPGQTWRSARLWP
ncbi:MAG: hypothetical protein CGW95_14545 [Phenylobacterium zucineum]|nr:MAG: hypothetical protein CGW95_14545 [Phenylobacterium zucineum]